jgi:transposase
MITEENYMDIKVLHRDGLSIREIARKLGIDRRTVKRHLDRPGLPEYEKRARQTSKLEAYYPTVKRFLEEDDYKATWIYDRLRQQGYEGSYDLVRRYVQDIKGELSRLAYVRFETGCSLYL